MIDWEAAGDSPALTAHERQITTARDVQGALDLARTYVADDPVRAKAWFLFAVRHGDPDILWQVVDTLLSEPAGMRDVGPWLRKLAIRDFPRIDAPSIAVSLDLFAQISPRGVAVMTADPVLFVHAEDPVAAREALRAAASHLADDPRARVSDLTAAGTGAHVRIDCAATERPAVIHRAVNAVVDELLAAGVDRAYLRLADGADWLPPRDSGGPIPDEVQSIADRALADESPDLAVHFARWCFANFHRQLGEAWLRWAAARRPELAWSIAGLDDPGFWSCEGWRCQDWMRRAVQTDFPRIDAPHVLVSSELFSPTVLDGSAGYGVDTTVQVVSGDADTAARVLERVSARFARVADTGQELTEAEMDDLFTDHCTLEVEYTPNYVSDVSWSDGHPWLWMDWKDGTYPLMARRMATILAQELAAAGLVAQVRPVPRSART